MPKPVDADLARNRLLAALPAEERDRLLSRMDSVTLDYKQVLGEANQRMEHIYFPTSGVVSMIATTQDGQRIEVGTIGNEGMVGLWAFLGADTSPLSAVVQVQGGAERIGSDEFRRAVLPGSRTHDLLLRYAQAMFVFVAQSQACNRLHTIERRCCRWILLTHDRVRGDEFPLTQEFLSEMLGVRRASVNEVARELGRTTSTYSSAMP